MECFTAVLDGAQGFKCHRLQRSVEVWAMKSRRILFVFLLGGCLYLLAGFHGTFLGRCSSSPGATFPPDSLPGAAIIGFR